MKQTKRLLALLMVLTMLLSYMAPAVAAAEEDETVISLWTYPLGSWGDEEAVGDLIANFEEANPGIRVDVTFLDYRNGPGMVEEAIANGDTPDLIMEGPEYLVADYGARGLMLDLSDLLDEEDMDELYPNALNAGYGSDGCLYLYPLAGTVHTMAINKTVFEAAGAMDYLDEESRTWNSTEDFFDAVRTVYEYTEQSVGMVFCGGMGGDQATRALVTNLCGGSYTDPEHTTYTWNSPENIAALEALRECEGLDFHTIFVGADEIAMLRSGDLNMAFCWNIAEHQIPDADGNPGRTNDGDEIMFMAFPSDSAPQLQSGIWGFGAFDNGDEARAEAAKAFVKHMCDSEATPDAITTTTYFPLRTAAEGTDLSGLWADAPQRDAYNAMMPMMGDYYQTTPNWREARTCWYMMLQDVANGEDIPSTLEYWNNMANMGTKTVLDVITVIYGDQTADWWVQFEQEFEAAYPTVDLQLECTTWNDIYPMVFDRLENGAAPDILQLDIYADFVDSLLPVEAYMSEETYAKFFPNFLAESEMDGTVWAVPDLTSARGLYYNKDLLDAAGVEVPTNWEELEQVCAAIKEYYGDEVYPWGLDMTANEGQLAFALSAWNNGGGFLDTEDNWALNSDANVEGIEYIIDLCNEGYTTPLDQNRYDIQQLFLDGKVAMMVNNDYFANIVGDMNVGIAPIPANGDNESWSVGVLDRFMCFDNAYSDERLAAVTAFFDFFYDDARHAQWVQMEGMLPATSTAMEVIAEEDPAKAVWTEILSHCKFYPSHMPEWLDVRNGVIDVLAQALEGGNVRQLLDALQARITGTEVIAEGTCGESVNWTLKFDGTLIISGSGDMDSYTSANGQPWHDWKDQIIRVVVEGSVNSVGSYAFYGLPNLVSVTIEEGVTAIGGHAMKYCSNLASVTLPGSVTEMGGNTFFGSNLLTTAGPMEGDYSIRFGWIDTIPSYAFDSMTQLVNITLPDNLTLIGYHAFFGCSALTSIELPDSLELIGYRAFEQSGLTSIVLPDSVTEFGMEAFEYAPLTHVTLSNNLIGIPYKSFSHCDELTQITIPASVTEIGVKAFDGCTALTEITFLGSAPSMESTAFSGVTADARYPAGDASWTEDVLLNYGGTINWIPDCSQGHAVVEDEAVSPTCTETGLTAGSHCSACGEILEAQETVAATGHSYDAVVTEPGCLEGGYTTHTCSACGDSFVDSHTDPMGHDYENGACIRCGYVCIESTVAKASNVASSGKIKLTWTKVEGAAKYQVYRATSKSGPFTLMKTTTGISYTNTSAVAGTQYYYYVVAVNADGVTSAPSNTVSRSCDLPRPTVTAANVASSGKIKLTWNAVEGAVKYQVYRATSSTGTYTLMKTTTSTSYTNTSAKAGNAYYYKVIAVHTNTAANSAYSTVVSRTCDLAQPVVTAKNVASSGKITLSWNAVDGASSYKVYRATSKTGTYTLMKTTTGTSYTNTSAKAGTQYYYKVIAVHTNTAANSVYSAVVSRTCDLARPEASITTSSAGKPRVTWDAVDGAVSYKVYRATSKAGTYTLMKTTTSTSYTNTSAKSGTTYYYKVMAVHSASAANSAYSTVVSIKSK